MTLLIIWAPIAALQGYVLENLWNWFIASSGIHSITFSTAVGISLIISLMTAHLIQLENKKDMLAVAWFWLASQLLIFGIGYLLQMAITTANVL